MIEAKREYAVFDDVDEDTFIRFTQFAYTGDYAVAEPDVLLSQSDVGVESDRRSRARSSTPKAATLDDALQEQPEPEPEPEPEPPEDELWGFKSTKHRKQSKKKMASAWADDRDEETIPAPISTRKSKGERLWDAFQAKASVKHPEAWRPNVNTDHCEDYTPVFLCHAKLYMFADKYSIEPLSGLVLRKLRLNLSEFILHSQRIGDIIELLKYTYEHTTDYEERIDRLRNLVAEYVVCHIEKIVGFDDFTKLLQENGDVGKDLMPKLMQRLD